MRKMNGISTEWIILYVILIFFCLVVLFGIAGQLNKIVNHQSYLSNIEKLLDDIHSEIVSIKGEIESLKFEGITISKEPPIDWGD